MNSPSQYIDLWNGLRSQLAAQKLQMLQSGQLVINNRTMNFVYKTKGSRPNNGYTLIFGFHGGGGTTPQANNQQYNNHKNLYNNFLPDGSIWFTPRACQDAWDMWFKDYLDDFILEIIRAFALNGLIDCNKVFITGYSAGGDGVYQMTPRLVDYLAGAAMMAGHPNGIHSINLRNIAFSIQVGQNDNSYNRKNEGIKYIRMLNQLAQNYGGYNQRSLIQPGKPHWMDLQDAQVFSWLLNFTRNPYPEIILFKQPPRRKKTTFYYLRLGQGKGKQDEQLMCFKQGNTFKIFSNRTITVLVNRNMIDPSSPIVVIHNGQVTVKKNMQPNIEIAKKTLYERLDPYYMFEDQFVSQPPNVIDVRSHMCKIFNIAIQQKEAEYEKSLPANSGQIPPTWSKSVNPLVPRKAPLNLAATLSQFEGSIGQIGQQTNNNLQNQNQNQNQGAWNNWGNTSPQQNNQQSPQFQKGGWSNQQGGWGNNQQGGGNNQQGGWGNWQGEQVSWGSQGNQQGNQGWPQQNQNNQWQQQQPQQQQQQPQQFQQQGQQQQYQPQGQPMKPWMQNQQQRSQWQGNQNNECSIA